MKFGVREICDVVFRAKDTMIVGKKKFYKHEPVIYFDSLKTSTLEGTVTTVYAQGGKGNARLMGWDGEKTVTFTMEDALISPLGMQILTGAGLIEAAGDVSADPVSETIDIAANSSTSFTVEVSNEIDDTKLIKVIIPNGVYNNFVYTFNPEVDNNPIAVSTNKKTLTITDTALANGEIAEGEATVIYYKKSDATIDSTKTIKIHTTYQARPTSVTSSEVRVMVKGKPYSIDKPNEHYIYVMALDKSGDIVTEPYCVGVHVDFGTAPVIKEDGSAWYTVVIPSNGGKNDLTKFNTETPVLVDYYVEKASGVTQINITPNSLGGNFYVEASTLFRNQAGVDMPAEFIIPNGKVQSNFTFTMASTGDPSTFTFTMDAFPDYTRFDLEEKVFASIQIVEEDSNASENIRTATAHR